MAKNDFIKNLRDLFKPKSRPTVRAEKLPDEARNVKKHIDMGANGKLTNVRSESAALTAIADAAQRGKRIQITVTDTNYSKSNGPAHLYTGGRMKPNGIDAEYLLNEMKKAGMGLDEMLVHHHTTSSCGPLPELEDIALYTIREM